MELIMYVVIAVIGVWAGWHIRGIIFTAAISEDPDKIIKILEDIKKINLEESGNDNKVNLVPGAEEVTPEFVSNTWYLYAKGTGQFLGQGPTLDDAMIAASKRFPTKMFWCNEAQNNNQTA